MWEEEPTFNIRVLGGRRGEFRSFRGQSFSKREMDEEESFGFSEARVSEEEEESFGISEVGVSAEEEEKRASEKQRKEECYALIFFR